MLKQYFEGYQSEEDEDYNPTKLQQAMYRQQHQKRQKARCSSRSAHQLYMEMKAECQEKDKNTQKHKEDVDPLELAKNILNSDSIKPNKRIVFAGKEFILNEETGQLQIVEKKMNLQNLTEHHNEHDAEEFQRRKSHVSYQYLNHVMRAIYNRSRKINSVGKSKLDWNGFVKQEGIEQKLKYNRKGGVIEDMQFIKKTN